MLKKIRKTIIFFLTAAMIVSVFPVAAEAKKLGKVEVISGAPEDPYDDWDGETWDLTSKDTFYCKPGDTFTLTSDAMQEEIEFTKKAYEVKSVGKPVWHSSNPEVATVNQKGKVTVKGEGVTAITVTCMVTRRPMLSSKYDTYETIFFRHWIRSGSDKVFDLKKSNVKSVAKKWNADDQNSAIRIKGTCEDNEELFLALMAEIRKLRKDEINKGKLDWNDTAYIIKYEKDYTGPKSYIYRTSQHSTRYNNYCMKEIGDFCYIVY